MYSKVIVTPVTEPFGAGRTCCGGERRGPPGGPGGGVICAVIRALYTPSVAVGQCLQSRAKWGRQVGCFAVS